VFCPSLFDLRLRCFGINPQDDSGDTPLVSAARQDDGRCVRLLLEHAPQVSFQAVLVDRQPVERISIFSVVIVLASGSPFVFS